MSETAVQEVHTHVCMHCAKQKKNTVWVHGDDNAGVIGLHTCPECGHIEWRKFIVEPGKLPQLASAKKANYDMLLGYIVLAVGIALLAYGAFLYVKKVRDGSEIVGTVD